MWTERLGVGGERQGPAWEGSRHSVLGASKDCHEFGNSPGNMLSEKGNSVYLRRGLAEP